ncbi:DgyrCDS3588 [Dimorphilus gyrociliatus]|uniref:DgyrCDS3588 n=1 Tax=Dimorphilus gyrociliatus TaxID=2664684 RepID=A0A7I8VFJ9_9ANNE|nr:DgyrCDS3588 [Dimorphilus gyrociliatus]
MKFNFSVTQPGINFGLELVLNTDQPNYFLTSSVNAGYRILLHEPDAIPLMDTSGFNAGAGESVLVGFEKNEFVRLPAPYGDCEDNPNYRYDQCISNCKRDYFFEKCKCRPIYFKGTSRLCNPVEIIACIYPRTTEYFVSNQQSRCNCRRQCSETKFTYSLSTSRLSDLTIKKFKELTENDIETNILVLNLYYHTLEYKETTVKPAYSILALLADVGGAFGLLLGSTALTFFELGDWLLVSLFSYFHKKFLEKKVSVTKVEPIITEKNTK